MAKRRFFNSKPIDSLSRYRKWKYVGIENKDVVKEELENREIRIWNKEELELESRKLEIENQILSKMSEIELNRRLESDRVESDRIEELRKMIII